MLYSKVVRKTNLNIYFNSERLSIIKYEFLSANIKT